MARPKIHHNNVEVRRRKMTSGRVKLTWLYRCPSTQRRVTLTDEKGNTLDAGKAISPAAFNAAASRAEARAAQLVNNEKAQRRGRAPGDRSIAALFEAYRASGEFEYRSRGSKKIALSPNSLKEKQDLLEVVVGALGHLPSLGLSTPRAEKFLAKVGAEKGAATSNHLRAWWSAMMLWATRKMGTEWATSNVIRDTRKLDENTTKYRSWPLELMDVWCNFCRQHENETIQTVGVATELNVLTGQRQIDILKMMPPNDHGNITIIQQKTGSVVGLPVKDLPGLQALLDRIKLDPNQPIIRTVKGQGYSKEGFSTAFGRTRAAFYNADLNTLSEAVQRAVARSNSSWSELATSLKAQKWPGLRNHFAVHTFLNNPDMKVNERLEVIQQVLGHTNRAMSLHYMHQIAGDIASAKLKEALKGLR